MLVDQQWNSARTRKRWNAHEGSEAARQRVHRTSTSDASRRLDRIRRMVWIKISVVKLPGIGVGTEGTAAFSVLRQNMSAVPRSPD
jgi:hypothetical protein